MRSSATRAHGQQLVSTASCSCCSGNRSGRRSTRLGGGRTSTPRTSPLSTTSGIPSLPCSSTARERTAVAEEGIHRDSSPVFRLQVPSYGDSRFICFLKVLMAVDREEDGWWWCSIQRDVRYVDCSHAIRILLMLSWSCCLCHRVCFSIICCNLRAWNNTVADSRK